MILKDKLHNTKMSKGESITSYLCRLTQVGDEFVVIGEMIVDDKLVWIALNGFLKHWEVFVSCWQRSPT